MNSTLNNKKYKIQNKEEDNLSSIEGVINKLDYYYDVIDQFSGGGKLQSKKDDKYLNKYKNLIKSSKNSIKYYTKSIIFDNERIEGIALACEILLDKNMYLLLKNHSSQKVVVLLAVLQHV